MRRGRAESAVASRLTFRFQTTACADRYDIYGRLLTRRSQGYLPVAQILHLSRATAAKQDIIIVPDISLLASLFNATF